MLTVILTLVYTFLTPIGKAVFSTVLGSGHGATFVIFGGPVPIPFGGGVLCLMALLYLGGTSAMMQYAWGHATSGFTSSDPLYGTMAISLSLSAVLLILWAIQSFRGRPIAGTMGVVATIIHILATAFSLLMFLEGFDGNAFMPVVIAVGVLAIATLVLAIIQKRAGKR